MFTISKEFHFSAGHKLEGLSEFHPCTNPHGHNYTIIVELSSTMLDEHGFVMDYRRLEPIKKFIDSTLDHKFLNDVLNFNPTAENIAKFIFNEFRKLYPQMTAVSVKETDKTLAKYSPDNDPFPDKII